MKGKRWGDMTPRDFDRPVPVPRWLDPAYSDEDEQRQPEMHHTHTCGYLNGQLILVEGCKPCGVIRRLREEEEADGNR